MAMEENREEDVDSSRRRVWESPYVRREDGEVGEEDEDVGEDVADDEEGPGVDHVGLTGSQEVHRARIEISLVHISTIQCHSLTGETLMVKL